MKIRLKECRPFQNMILVRFDDIEQIGGVLMPSGYVKTVSAKIGQIRALGGGGFTESGFRRPIELSVGDYVLIAGAGLDVEVDGVEMEMHNIDTVLAVVTPATEDAPRNTLVAVP